MNFEDVKKIIEKAKEETLVKIVNTEPMMALVNINNEGVNHGVMQMYYKILAALYDLETARIRAETEKTTHDFKEELA